MERLTKEELNILGMLYGEFATVQELQVHKAVKELQKYRELEEKGMLLQLPCKVSEAVYVIDRESEKINHAIIDRFMYVNRGRENKRLQARVFLHREFKYKDVPVICINSACGEIFTTEEAAEDALRIWKSRDKKEAPEPSAPLRP